MVDEDTFQKIWKITNDLTTQQQTNQELASSVKSQLADLKVLMKRCQGSVAIISEPPQFYI